jgi:hypothetical protein
MLAFIPWPNFRHLIEHSIREGLRIPPLGECVWQASPAIKMRSFTEYRDATRWPTAYSHEYRTDDLTKDGAYFDITSTTRTLSTCQGYRDEISF